MPLKLVPPRAGKTTFWYVRGHYIGVALDRSTQATDERTARKILRTWKDAIERGEYRAGPSVVAIQAQEPTFLSAMVAYIQAGGDRKFLSPILEMTGEHALRDRPLKTIDQIAIDNAATVLYPNGTSQTRNRQFYTPVSAVLKRAGIEWRVKRPKGWRGKKATSWLEPNQAFSLFAAADGIETEFGLLLRTWWRGLPASRRGRGAHERSRAGRYATVLEASAAPTRAGHF